MSDPVSLITAARRRIARVAAARTVLRGAPPSVVTLALGLFLAAIGRAILSGSGYALAPSLTRVISGGLVAGGLAGLGLMAFMAWRQYRKSAGFIDAAERIDDLVGAKQQIVTLATLSDPAATHNYQPTALFPILLQRASGYLANFDPRSRFQLEPGAPLIRSSLASLAIVVALALAMLALVRPPSPYEVTAQQLRSAADQLTQSDSSEAAADLARRMRAAASALDNPALAPAQKLEQLAAVEHAIQQREAGDKNNQAAAAGSEKGTSTSSAGKGQSGEGSGKGEGKGGSAEGTGEGSGEAKNGKGSGTGSGTGDKQKQDAEQMAELQKNLQNAQNKLESSDNSNTANPEPKPGDNNPGKAPKPGENPNQPGGNKADKGAGMQDLNGGNKPTNAAGNDLAKARDQGQAGKPDKDTGVDIGDTRLGQFPTPGKYERFYKPGEHGPALELRNAKYVLFRIPPAEPAGGAGKTVLDKDRPVASTPYTNTPLGAERIQATPDEQQLVPPRYRDLIQ